MKKKPKKTTNSYWQERAKSEKAWQIKQFKEDEHFSKVLARDYQIAVDNINKEIKANIDLIGGTQNLVTGE